MLRHFGFFGPLLIVCLLLIVAACATPVAPRSIALRPIGTYATGRYHQSAAEIPAYDAISRRLFIVNAEAATIDIVDIADPSRPVLLDAIDVTPYGAVANSVAVRAGIVAVAVEAETKTDPGKVVLFDVGGRFRSEVTVGALPDMLTFTPDGRQLVVANEGEPASDYDVDPEGTVSIISLGSDPGRLTQQDVRTVRFTDFNVGNARHGTLDPRIRIFGPHASVAQDLEPEYIAVSSDSRTAYVTLQENNAIAAIDLASASVTRLMALDAKDHRVPGHGLDASDQDDRINIAQWPVRGLYQPDGIAVFEHAGATFLVTANEGDPRTYEALQEEVRLEDAAYKLDPQRFPNAETLKRDDRLGRLKVSTASGDTDGDGDMDEIHALGSRSFAIWSATGELIYDSGDDFERIIAETYPAHFNVDTVETLFDVRSDDRGPEPEAITVARLDNRTLLCIALETVGGVMIYDASDPYNPAFVQYINNRDFAAGDDMERAGDLGPEGLLFIPADASPNQRPLLVVSNEASGTTTIYTFFGD